MGGACNEEIFNRTVERVTESNFDLVIVSWSGVNRKWVYYKDPNVDDFTIVNREYTSGFKHSTREVQEYRKLYYAYFHNQYMALKSWLLQTIALAEFLENRNQPYVFIKGHENKLDQYKQVSYDPTVGFVNLSEHLKIILDLDSRPDYYVKDKLDTIQRLITQTRNYNWLNFDDLPLEQADVDLSDDNCHPGPESNRILTQQLISYCNTRQLL